MVLVHEVLETVSFILVMVGVGLFTMAHSPKTLFEQLVRGDLEAWGFTLTFIGIFCLGLSIGQRRRTGDSQ